MLTFDYSPGLTKDKILSLTTEQDIIESFLGHKVDFKRAITSPLREERSPSFTFKKVGNKIIFRDWGSGLYGDAFTLVQKLYNCSFAEALCLINDKLNLQLTDLKIDAKLIIKEKSIPADTTTSKSTSICIEKQVFTLTDYKYWKQHGISIPTLYKYNVKSCKYAWINGQLSVVYSSLNPAYAYVFKSYGRITYKIYRPFAEKQFKWICNTSPSEDIEGFDMLEWHADVLILTKSMKDVMCLHELGYNAISLQGEANKYPYELHNKLKDRFQNIVVFYDNDQSGVLNGNRIAADYGLKTIFIPLETTTKDISDFVAKYSMAEAKELMSKLLQ